MAICVWQQKFKQYTCLRNGDTLELKITLRDIGDADVEFIDVAVYAREKTPAPSIKPNPYDYMRGMSFAEFNELMSPHELAAPSACAHCGSPAHRLHEFRQREVCSGCGAFWE